MRLYTGFGEIEAAYQNQPEELALMLAATAHGKAPSQIRVFPYGKFELEESPPITITVDQESINNIVADFARRGNEMVIDYEHQSRKGAEAPAAGWITELIDRGTKGLWASVSWTQKAKDFLENREYRYFSPTFWVRQTDKKVVRLINIALTNNPKTNNMVPLVASMDSHSLPWNVLSEDQRRLNTMLGIDDQEWLVAASGTYIPQERMFETDEEKLKKMLGDL